MATRGVAADTVDLTNIVFPYPDEHYALDGARLERELGVTMSSPPRRMLEDFVGTWDAVADHRPRVYAREQQALRALGLEAGDA